MVESESNTELIYIVYCTFLTIHRNVFVFVHFNYYWKTKHFHHEEYGPISIVLLKLGFIPGQPVVQVKPSSKRALLIGRYT